MSEPKVCWCGAKLVAVPDLEGVKACETADRARLDAIREDPMRRDPGFHTVKENAS